MRPTIDQTLLDVAAVYAARSTCSRLHVGAVISDSRGVVLSSGYNGALSGMPHCQHPDRSEPCREAVHAEQNAILWAARRGVALDGATAYVTHEPCYECSKALVQVGIRRVVYATSYPRNSGVGLLVANGVDVARLGPGIERRLACRYPRSDGALSLAPLTEE